MVKEKKIILFDIDYTVFNMGLFRDTDLKTYEVYEEVHEVLEQLKEVADLGIFSQGEVAFQNRKLIETSIEHYFLREHIHIVKEKEAVIEEILKKYRKSGKLFLVDDRLPILQLAQQLNPKLMTFWVKRGFFAENQQPITGFEPDATVLTLREIVPLITHEIQ